MGKTGISIACDAGYHERAWRGCHAAQSVFTFGDHSEPEVESERRSGDSETIEFEFKDTLFSMIIDGRLTAP